MTVDVCEGLQMPFFPMRPTRGRDLKTLRSVNLLWQDIQDDERWITQPKLNGDRVCLAVVDRRVFLQNRYGCWYRFKVENSSDFLKLPDGTCFDGEVFKCNFYPFEALALKGTSLMLATAQERAVWAKDLAESLNHPWMFQHPAKPWLLRRNENLPAYEGVVLKKSGSPYVVLGSASQTHLYWFKRIWS